MSFKDLVSSKVQEQCNQERKELEVRHLDKYTTSFPEIKAVIAQITREDISFDEAKHIVDQYNTGKELSDRYQKDYIQISDDIRLKIYNDGATALLAVDDTSKKV